jgi:hypothetical protein
MAIYREFFSGSTDGTPIAITSTDSAGAQTIHTCSTRKGEIYLFAGNKSTAAVEFFAEHGDTVSPTLRNGKVVKGYCSTVSTAAIFVIGYVNELSS